MHLGGGRMTKLRANVASINRRRRRGCRPDEGSIEEVHLIIKRTVFRPDELISLRKAHGAKCTTLSATPRFPRTNGCVTALLL